MSMVSTLLGAVIGFGVNGLFGEAIVHPVVLVIGAFVLLGISNNLKDLNRRRRVLWYRFRSRKERRRAFPSQPEWEQDEVYIDDYLRDRDRTSAYLSAKREAEAAWWQFWV